jgi:hypothetical protein
MSFINNIKELNQNNMNLILLEINNYNIGNINNEDIEELLKWFKYSENNEGETKKILFEILLNNGNINILLLKNLFNDFNNNIKTNFLEFFFKIMKEKIFLLNHTKLILNNNKNLDNNNNLNNNNNNEYDNDNIFLNNHNNNKDYIIKNSLKNLFYKKYFELEKNEDKEYLLYYVLDFIKYSSDCFEVICLFYLENKEEEEIKEIILKLSENKEFYNIIWNISEEILTKLSENIFKFYQIYIKHIISLLDSNLINKNDKKILNLLNSKNEVLTNLTKLVLKNY